MEVRIPKDKNFEFTKCKELYELNQSLINDDESFEDIANNTFFYSFYKDKTLIGCIYLYYKFNKLFLNGFSQRKYFLFNISALKKILEWFTCDVYVESVQKSAILVILRCGFKKIGKNLYVHYNETPPYQVSKG